MPILRPNPFTVYLPDRLLNRAEMYWPSLINEEVMDYLYDMEDGSFSLFSGKESETSPVQIGIKFERRRECEAFKEHFGL